MKRALAALAVIAAFAAVVAGIRHHQDATTQRVDVVFDTAKGMVPGQLVKIAGARAGRVSAVHLTAGHKARMELRIEDRFVPFHADAGCRILPEGPISENYVECSPGVQKTRPLQKVAGVPTVPLAHTTAPVSIQDLLNVFAAPTQTRLRLLVNELGIGTAGRGEDINDILRRANPTLRQARSLLAVVNSQRAELGDAIDQTDKVLAGVGARDGDVKRFVAGASATAQATAAHGAALASTLQRLPAMLDAARTGLKSIDRATSAGTPLLSGLQKAGPQLTEVTRSLPAFATAAVPAVRSATAISVQGRKTVKTTRKLGRSLKALGGVEPAIATLRDFMVASRDKGAIENLLRVAYALGNLSSLYNGVSHVVTLFAGVPLQCLVPGIEAPGCNQRYDGPRVPLNDPRNLGVTKKLLREALAKLLAGKRHTNTHAIKLPSRPAAGHAPAPAKSLPKTVQGLLGELLANQTSNKGGNVAGLLDYLLK